MQENSKWQNPCGSASACLNSFWKKMPTRQQALGGILMATGFTCMSVSVIFNISDWHNPSILLIVAGLVEYNKEDIPPSRTNLSKLTKR